MDETGAISTYHFDEGLIGITINGRTFTQEQVAQINQLYEDYKHNQ